VRSLEEVDWVKELVETGLNDCAIARLTGLPRTTVRDWRQTQRWVPRQRTGGRSNLFGRRARSCMRCGHPLHRFSELDEQYVYLLGLYLGDGYLAQHRREVYRLTISLDARYPGIVAECREAIQTVLPTGRVGVHFRYGGTCAWVTNSSKQWPCLFPQHGAGKKHERRIELSDWQRPLVEQHPQALLRGLIHSDGWRGINRVRHGDTTYEYPRYTFTNRSDDIKRIFCDACDLLGIEWRVMNRWNISVARREAVARLDEFVGPKA
jgi:hypothetical protein